MGAINIVVNLFWFLVVMIFIIVGCKVIECVFKCTCLCIDRWYLAKEEQRRRREALTRIMPTQKEELPDKYVVFLNPFGPPSIGLPKEYSNV